MRTRLTLAVSGTAVPQGSKSAVTMGRRVGVVDNNHHALVKWRGEVADRAMRRFEGPIIEGSVRLRLVFVRVRKQGDFTSRGFLSSAGAAVRKFLAPCQAPDLGKLARGVEDALSGVVYRDDSQVVWTEYRKVWGTSERVLVMVEELEEEDRMGLCAWLDEAEVHAATPLTTAEFKAFHS